MGYFIDESNNQGSAAGNYRAGPVVRAYFKRSEGTTFVDSTFSERMVAAHDAGAQVGAYHFGGHANPVAEADHFLSLPGTRPHPGQLRPCLDDEVGASDWWVEQFLLRCHAVLGYWPAYYANTSTGAPRRQRSQVVRQCPWWRAEANGVPAVLMGGRMGAAAHQYTFTGSVPGLVGPRDLSVLLGPNALLVPHPRHKVHRSVAWGWRWAAWWMGLPPYKGRARVRRLRPDVPTRVPKGWWRFVRWYRRHGFKVNDK